MDYTLQDIWSPATLRPFVMSLSEAQARAKSALLDHYKTRKWLGATTKSGGGSPSIDILAGGALAYMSGIPVWQDLPPMLIGVYVSCREGTPRFIVGRPGTMHSRLFEIVHALDMSTTFFKDSPDSVWHALSAVDYKKTDFNNMLGPMSFLDREHLPPAVAWSLRGLSIEAVKTITGSNWYYRTAKGLDYSEAAQGFRVEYATVPVASDPAPYRAFLEKYGRLPFHQDELPAGPTYQGKARTVVTPLSQEPVPVNTWIQIVEDLQIRIDAELTYIRPLSRETRAPKDSMCKAVPTTDLELLAKLPPSDRLVGLAILADSLRMDQSDAPNNGTHKIFEMLLRYGRPSLNALKAIEKVITPDRLSDAIAGVHRENPRLLSCQYTDGARSSIKRCIPLDVPEKVFVGWILSRGCLPTKKEAEALMASCRTDICKER